MPERWEAELRRMRSVTPTADLWERAERGPSRPGPPGGPSRRGRTMAALVSVIVVLAAGFGLWRAFGVTGAPTTAEPGPSPTVSPSGSMSGGGPLDAFVTLPDELSARLNGANGSQLIATVVVTTNLPDGTVAFVDSTYVGGTESGAGELSVSNAVHDGQLRIDVAWAVCDFGQGISLTVEFRPFYEDYTVPGPQGSPWPPTQPDEILQALGEHFQDITGDQVTTVDSSQGPINQIHLERDYPWPDAPSGFTPPPCPSPSPSG